MKTVPEERTGKILDEIDRAEKIFRKMFDRRELEEEISRTVNTRKAVAATKRSLH
jgi:hypothetical protein